MVENDVKSTSGETRLQLKIENDERFLIQNLTRRKKIYFKNQRVALFQNQKLTRCKFFNSNLCIL